jgi:hypothetical protein
MVAAIFQFIWAVITTILTITWTFIVTLVEALFGLFRIPLD